MTTRELKRLNHYPEFKTDADINNIIHFQRTGDFPNGLNARQRRDYNRKFGPESGFEVRQNSLFYHPNLPNRQPGDEINLEVVKPADREEKIKEIYVDIKRGLGTGLNAFYHQVCMSYLNIPKQVTDDFLRSQGDYIVRRIPKKAVNKPIITRVPKTSPRDSNSSRAKSPSWTLLFVRIHVWYIYVSS